MTVRRLSNAEKQQILELYRLPGETTSTLASRFEVSGSTISRVLKSGIPEAEYEELIHQKKRGIVAEEADPAVEGAAPNQLQTILPPQPSELPTAASPQLKPLVKLASTNSAPPVGERRARKRSSAKDSDLEEIELPASLADQQLSLPQLEVSPVEQPVFSSRPVLRSAKSQPLEELLTEAGVLEQESNLSSLNDDDLEEDDLEEDDLDDDLDEDLDDDDDDGEFDGEDLPETSLLVAHRGSQSTVQVLPFESAAIPRTCYLVVDRSAELVARPLREFGDLGQIPEAETLEKTLPIFDNHRIAKRFSNPRTQRVIKLPDGRILQKTSSHLQAKGITRLLIDGQVYSLN